MNVLKHYSAPLFGRLLTERAPIHTYTYREAIRAAKPYIIFLFIDIDTLPIVTNISLVRPDQYTLFISEAAQQPELHVHYRGGSRQGYGSQMPSIQAFRLHNQARFFEVTIPIAEQHIFLDVTLNPKDLRETPAVQSLVLDAQANSIEVPISIVKQHVSLGIMFNAKDQQERPFVQFLNLNAQIGFVEVTIPIGEQHVSLDASLNPKDLREIPIFQSHKLDTQASAVEGTISCTTRLLSLNVTFNPYVQPEKLVLLSHKQDMQASSVEMIISIVEQTASLDTYFNYDEKHEEISTIPYVLNKKSVRYTITASRKKHQYDSYNHSLSVIEPHCYNYPVAQTRTNGKIVRYHRYFRTSHIFSSNSGIDSKS